MTADQRMPQPLRPVWLRARPGAPVVIATEEAAGADDRTEREPAQERPGP